MNKKVLGLTCTNGRFTYLRRLLTCFLSQDYPNKVLIIYNNAEVPIEMESMSNVILVNNHIDKITGEPYADVGSMHRDAFSYCPNDVSFVSIMDDDDIYLPRHFSTAVDFFSKSPSCLVWQPGHYFYKHSQTEVDYSENKNNLEGSSIIQFDFLNEVGFGVGSSLNYNLHWYYEAKRRRGLFKDPQSPPTYCYEFGQPDIIHTSVFSTDKPQRNILELNNYRGQVRNYGNGEVLRPWLDTEIDLYFKTYFNLDSFVDSH